MSLASAVSDVFHDRSTFQFTAHRRMWFAVSAIVLLIGLGSLVTRGLNLGIDFEGGSVWQAEVEGGGAQVDEVRDVLRPLGEGNAKVTILGGGSAFRVQSITIDPDEVEEITAALAEYAGVPPGEVSLQSVGPTFGEAVTEQAIRALVIFVIAVSIYLAFRFEPKMAGAAMIALVHDVSITVGVYSVTGFEVTPATLIAILTILGYSLYDTVVVFDKVKENVDAVGTSSNRTYSEVVDRSLNQVLMRSLNTSFTTLIPVASLLVVGSWILGAVGIRDFSLALFVGLLAGTYSSIFVAAMFLAMWKEREPRYRSMRRRVEQRRGVPATVAAAGAEASTADAATGAVPDEDAELDEMTVEEREPARAAEGDRRSGVRADRSSDHRRDAVSDALDEDRVLRPRPRKPRRRKRR